MLFIKITLYVNAEGLIVPEEYKDIRVKVDAIVKKVFHQNGDYVKKGQAIMQLDESSLLSERNRLLIDIENSKTEINVLKSLITRQKQEENNLVAIETDNLTINQLELSQLQRDLDKAKNLYSLGIISNQELELIQNKVEILRIKIRGNESQLNYYRTRGSNEYQSKYDNLIKALAIEQNTFNTLESKINQCMIYSPVDGILYGLDEHIEGKMIRTGEKVAVVGDVHESMLITAEVPDIEIEKINLNQNVSVMINAYQYAWYFVFNGKVLKIDQEGHFSERYQNYYFTVKIKMDNGSTQKHSLWLFGKKVILRPNMTVKVRFITGQKRLIEILTKPWGYY
jgi:multidrug resistance efflux pump